MVCLLSKPMSVAKLERLKLPGIDQGQAAAFEIARVASCKGRIASFRDSGDLRVEEADRPSALSPVDRDWGKGTRRTFVEGKNAPRERGGEHRSPTGQHSRARCPAGQQCV